MGFKICAIGCGAMATTGHGPAYARYAALNADAELAACCDLDAGKAEKFRSSFGFSRCYTDMYEMFKAEKPDAVCLMAPVHLTSELAVKIIKAGYPVIMEKPPGRNREEAMSIIEAAERKGMFTRVSLNRRYAPLLMELKRQMEEAYGSSDNAAASIHNIRCDFFRIRRLDEDFSTTAIHGIDAVGHIAGSRYKEIRFTYQEFPQLGPKVTNIFMDCSFESGATAQLSFCPVTGAAFEHITVNTYGRTYLLDMPILGTIDYPGSLRVYDANKKTFEISGKDFSGTEEMFVLSGFYDENAGFFDALKKGARPSGDVASALQSVEIADCIRRRKSTYNGNNI